MYKIFNNGVYNTMKTRTPIKKKYFWNVGVFLHYNVRDSHREVTLITIYIIFRPK